LLGVSKMPTLKNVSGRTFLWKKTPVPTPIATDQTIKHVKKKVADEESVLAASAPCLSLLLHALIESLMGQVRCVKAALVIEKPKKANVCSRVFNWLKSEINLANM